jgi:1-acyl-sn-glycerol-3-phosphate acyltransferase
MRAWYAFIAWLARTLFRIFYGIRCTGLERVPKSGALLICSNHRSNLDPPLVGSTLPREISYFAKAELFRGKVFGSFLRSLNAFPVRRGQLDKAAIETSLRLLSRGQAMVFFPEGTRAPADGFLRAKYGIGWLLRKAKVPVLPIYLHGTGAAKSFGRGRPQLHLVVGEPIPAIEILRNEPEGRDGDQRIADRILDAIRRVSLETPNQLVKELGKIYDRDIIDNPKLR